jgi:hypothetical protein
MNFGSAFTFQFKQEDWITKILLASLVSLIPIIGLYFLAGWTLDIAARVIKGDTTLLPALDFSANLKRGFKTFVIATVHLLPNLIFLTPLLVIALLTQNTSSPNSISSALVISSLCLTLLMIVYNLVVFFILPAALGNFLLKGEKIGAGLHTRETFVLIRQAPDTYWMVFLGSILSGLIIAPLGGFICGVVALVTTVYAQSIYGSLLGQAYEQANP